MNMLLCRPEKITQICGNTLRCVVDDARRIEHIRNILKLQTGDECKAGVLNKGCFDGKVAEISNDKVIIEFDADSVENPPGKMPLTLFVAMQRPNTLKKVIHCAVTMGVEKICFFGSYKVEKSYWQSSVLQEKNLQFELDLALEQCKDPFEPEIVFCRYFKSFADDILAQAVAAGVDSLHEADILGCVAGDDCIIIVTRDEESAVAISHRIVKLINS